MIHGQTGTSSYFQGRFASYGKHQWNVKTYALDNDQLENLRAYILDKDWLAEEFGVGLKDVCFEGRSGGWLVVDALLTQPQIDKISSMVDSFKSDPAAFYKSIFE